MKLKCYVALIKGKSERQRILHIEVNVSLDLEIFFIDGVYYIRSY